MYFYGAPARFPAAGRGRGGGAVAAPAQGFSAAWGLPAGAPAGAAGPMGASQARNGVAPTNPWGAPFGVPPGRPALSPTSATGASAAGATASPSPSAPVAAGLGVAAPTVSKTQAGAAGRGRGRGMVAGWGAGLGGARSHPPAAAVPGASTAPSEPATPARTIVPVVTPGEAGNDDSDAASATAEAVLAASGATSSPEAPSTAPEAAARRRPVSWAAAVGRSDVKDGDQFRAEAPSALRKKKAAPEADADAAVTVVGARALPQRKKTRPQDDDPDVEVCRYFSSGNGCMYGSRCYYRHASAAPAGTHDFIHGSGTPAAAAGSASAPATSAAPAETATPAWVGEGAEGPPTGEGWGLGLPVLTPEEQGRVIAEETAASREAECAICMENPLRRGEWFGVLTGCTHSFCLSCIRAWRGRTDLPPETVRSCPACRAHSHFIVPSPRVLLHPTTKVAVLESYRLKLREIPCRNYDFGRGTCPFGSSCFYAHRLPVSRCGAHRRCAPRLTLRCAVDQDGTPGDAPLPRMRTNNDGETTSVGGVRLSEFL